jgi:hypothetical protein
LIAASRAAIARLTVSSRRLLASTFRQLRPQPAAVAQWDGQPPATQHTVAATPAGELRGQAARARTDGADSAAWSSSSPAAHESASGGHTSMVPQPTLLPAHGGPGHELPARPATRPTAAAVHLNGKASSFIHASTAVQSSGKSNQRQLAAGGHEPEPAAVRRKSTVPSADSAGLQPDAATGSAATARPADPAAGGRVRTRARQTDAAQPAAEGRRREVDEVAAAKPPSAREAVDTKEPTRKHRLFDASALAAFAALLAACGVAALGLTWRWRGLTATGARLIIHVPTGCP